MGREDLDDLLRRCHVSLRQTELLEHRIATNEIGDRILHDCGEIDELVSALDSVLHEVSAELP